MIPTNGRIVAYTITEDDAKQINKRRQDSIDHQRGRMANDGTVRHVGNAVSAGDCFPMMIVRVWSQTEGGAVNGQVFLDGTDTLWVTSRSEGDRPGGFLQYPRV